MGLLVNRPPSASIVWIPEDRRFGYIIHEGAYGAWITVELDNGDTLQEFYESDEYEIIINHEEEV